MDTPYMHLTTGGFVVLSLISVFFLVCLYVLIRVGWSALTERFRTRA